MGAGHAHALYVHGHSPTHALPAEVKVAATVTFVVAVAMTPPQEVWAFGVHALAVVCMVAISKVPIRFVALRLAGVLPFVAFALFLPFIGSGERVEVVGIMMSRDGLWGTWNIVAKALIGATASIVLVATTEVPDLLRGMARLRVPGVLVAIAGFMIRYLGLIVEEMGRMRTAMTSRGHDPRWLRQARPIATGAGAMFVRSYERGERIHAAMVSRGFEGLMPGPTHARVPRGQWLGTMALPALSVAVAVAALVTG